MLRIFEKCRSLVSGETWSRIAEAWTAGYPGAFPAFLARHEHRLSLPSFLPELAELEWAHEKVREAAIPSPGEIRQVSLNPALQLLKSSWKNLSLQWSSETDIPGPEPGEEWLLVWRRPGDTEVRLAVASRNDLLALKITAEESDPRELAGAHRLSVGPIEETIDRGVRKGILLAPPSKIRREPSFPAGAMEGDAFSTCTVFTLQWHITQACDLHCKHCYDRSDRDSMGLEQAVAVLEDLHGFCKERHVRGQVTFTGGNPLLYPHFQEVFRTARDLNFSAAILGNPAPRAQVERLVALDPPVYYQISLEGLEKHNDEIRGPGHFRRAMEFLGVLRELGIYSMVMLTLTRDNMDQVLPLADYIGEKADLFTFNRLSLTGEGARLRLPAKDRYAAFLESYAEAAEVNPVLGLKDNLLGILRHVKGIEPFGGCTGYGCGAAFNFVSLLADGEVHACRKFPSPIGNVLEQGMAGVYDSAGARKYRSGCEACRGCAIRPVCGGCMAMAHSFGLDVFRERDPFCFME
ncbi:MAG: thio(seleno)oxazole modification radical SAM maturase SbtM [Thermodesulfobacteriota bacterium]